MGQARRLVCIQAPDLRDLLVGAGEGGRKLERSLSLAIAASTPLMITEIGAQGWAGTLEYLQSDGDEGADDPPVLLTSVSSELADPSPDARESLIQLARFVQEDRRGRLAVLNASSLVPRARTAAESRHGERDPLDLRIRRLNLAVLEASHATGLSVVDADQLVAEMNAPHKVVAPFDYSPEVCDALQARLVAILDDLGFVERSVMEARVPFISGGGELTVESWLKTEGDIVGAEDVICELRLGRIRQMACPRSAIDLAAIDGRKPLMRVLFSREQERWMVRDTVLPLVARDSGFLRRILRPAGAKVRAGDHLAVFTRDAETHIDESTNGVGTFRAVLRTENPVAEMLL